LQQPADQAHAVDTIEAVNPVVCLMERNGRLVTTTRVSETDCRLWPTAVRLDGRVIDRPTAARRTMTNNLPRSEFAGSSQSV